jgi:hypothetical protein
LTVSPAKLSSGQVLSGACNELVAGWRSGGVDRAVRLTGPELAAAMVLSRARARATLPAEYRGPHKAFGPIVDVPDAAPPLARLIGFMGRTPA